MDNYRSQIAANLRILRPSLPPLGEGVEIITSWTSSKPTANGVSLCQYAAFIIATDSITPKVIMKGHGQDSPAKAIANLLAVTSQEMRIELGAHLVESVEEGGGQWEFDASFVLPA
ncbi:unnamed protein product [Zymoseptoria tritici ST99CH_3D1]|nr:unnamed protein product [Zymoseptoria tritici ST99CH_3D1]